MTSKMAAESIKHSLVPKHTKLSFEETKKLLETYNIELGQLPRILAIDPAIAKLSVKVGDIIAIERESKTAGRSIYYRAVVEN